MPLMPSTPAIPAPAATVVARAARTRLAVKRWVMFIEIPFLGDLGNWSAGAGHELFAHPVKPRCYAPAAASVFGTESLLSHYLLATEPPPSAARPRWRQSGKSAH